MASSRRKPSRFNSGSMTDYLISVTGLALLTLFFQQPRLSAGWGKELRLVYIIITAGLILWGVRKPLGYWFPFFQSKKIPHPSGRSISWSGILLIFIGLEFIYWAMQELLTWADPLLLFLLGGYLILWGAKEILLQQVPRLRSTRARQRVMLPRPGIVYLVIMFVMLAGSLLGRSNMLMLVFSLMAGPFILNGWITFTMLKKLDLSRVLPESVMAGERLVIDVTLSNNKRWFSSWLMTMTDDIRNSHEELIAKILFVRIPAKSARVGKYEICLMQRGRYQFGPLKISSRFPLGLTERGLEFNGMEELLVLPRLGRLTTAWRQNSQKAAELVEEEQQRRSAFDDEFHSIREYRRGDNPRAIHWRTSAKQNELMVREYRQSRDRHWVLLLDLWQPENPNQQDILQVETAISFVATICVEQMKKGRNAMIRVVTTGENVSDWRGTATPANMESLLRDLAEVQSGTKPDTTQLVEIAALSRSTNTQILLITTRPLNEVTSEVSDEKNIVTQLQKTVGNDLLVVPANQETLQRYFEIEPI
ncbi:hypothetical protein MNBD_PLANCTO02-505 [hydrothermal vent metagenome]|uniref:DUF58 domain-containing protein n=1 Tax=hydrothermal vent metagenome TaxID=652676 RepID=A0A3B1DG83_9ZZZZ